MSGGGTVRLLGIAGSPRRGSFNAATLRTAQELAPDGMTIESFDIAPIPLYNEDVRQQEFPAPVRGSAGAHQGDRRFIDRDARVQLFDSWRSEERD
jgi:NADPH-dependent FMN reductase